MLALLVAAALTTAPAEAPTVHAAREADPRAVALVDSAMARMGGRAALEAVRRVRYDFITMWQRSSWEARPYRDLPSYEKHVDVRDYDANAWRNTREFPTPAGWRTVVDLVVDDVAVRDMGQGFQPLNVTYVDERDELFTYSADRVLLAVRAAPDLRTATDTIIGNMTHARVMATLADAPATLFIRRGDGLPAMLRLRRAHPNDFGLVPFGRMDIEVWYSNWAAAPGGLALPRQWDVARAGAPYKRMTVLALAINPALAADSFDIAQPLRAAWAAAPAVSRPMHDVPFDSARVVDDNFIEFRAFGAPAGAVRVGGAWVLLEAGQSPLSAERASARLQQLAGSAPAHVIIGGVAGNGGYAHIVRHGLPHTLAPGFAPLARRILEGHAVQAQPRPLAAPLWLRVGTDSLRVEGIDLPDAAGSIVVYAPALRWVWSPQAFSPLDVRIVLDRARERGWTVERVGSLRQLSAPVR